MALAPEISKRPHIAVAVGDPNGIGPEIALKAALDPAVRSAARLCLVADEKVIVASASRLGFSEALNALYQAGDVELTAIDVLQRAAKPGAVTADGGRAAVVYAEHAISLAISGQADAVVAAPHNQVAIAKANIPFDGYPGLLARATGSDPDRVFLMLVAGDLRIVHVTLHLSLRTALDAITQARILSSARAADRALKAAGLAAPRLAACAINPHAGEAGLFGSEDDEIVRPAVLAAQADGIDLARPFGADTLLSEGGYDAYLAMYHDQGHIPIKQAGRGRALGLSIGTPVLFATVAHGSAHDIAGRGVADATAFIGAIVEMAKFLKSDAKT